MGKVEEFNPIINTSELEKEAPFAIYYLKLFLTNSFQNQRKEIEKHLGEKTKFKIDYKDSMYREFAKNPDKYNLAQTILDNKDAPNEFLELTSKNTNIFRRNHTKYIAIRIFFFKDSNPFHRGEKLQGIFVWPYLIRDSFDPDKKNQELYELLKKVVDDTLEAFKTKYKNFKPKPTIIPLESKEQKPSNVYNMEDYTHLRNK